MSTAPQAPRRQQLLKPLPKRQRRPSESKRLSSLTRRRNASSNWPERDEPGICPRRIQRVTGTPSNQRPSTELAQRSSPGTSMVQNSASLRKPLKLKMRMLKLSPAQQSRLRRSRLRRTRLRRTKLNRTKLRLLRWTLLTRTSFFTRPLPLPRTRPASSTFLKTAAARFLPRRRSTPLHNSHPLSKSPQLSRDFDVRLRFTNDCTVTTESTAAFTKQAIR